MKTITIRELHHNTGEWVRKAAKFGEIHVSERGKTIAKIVPQTSTPEVPYFARRKLSPEFRRIMHRLRGGTDSTQIISEDRDGSLSFDLSGFNLPCSIVLTRIAGYERVRHWPLPTSSLAPNMAGRK